MPVIRTSGEKGREQMKEMLERAKSKARQMAEAQKVVEEKKATNTTQPPAVPPIKKAA
jgi:hypothetical protein